MEHVDRGRLRLDKGEGGTLAYWREQDRLALGGWWGIPLRTGGPSGATNGDENYRLLAIGVFCSEGGFIVEIGSRFLLLRTRRKGVLRTRCRLDQKGGVKQTLK